MRTKFLAASMLLFATIATIAPAAAQSAGTVRAQREKEMRALEAALEAARADQSAAALQRRAELEAALAARADQAATIEQRMEMETALQAAQADRVAGATDRRMVVETALRAAQADRDAAGMDQRMKVEAALREAQADRGAAAALDRRLEVEAALRALETDHETALAALYGDGPRASWAPQDPADSLWRRAREQLNAGQYAAAAKAFRQIRTESRFSKSAYRPDAFYWEAFALTRSGGTDSLRQAKQVLEELDKAYPPEQRSPDARALATRIDAELAGQGNAAATRDLYGRIAAAQNAETRAAIAAGSRTLDQSRIALQAQQAELERLRLQAVVNQSSNLSSQISATNADTYRAAQQGLVSGRLQNSSAFGGNLFSARQNPQCSNDDEEIRLIALNALVEMDDSAALPALREVLARRDECAPQLRRQAMMIIARKASPGTESLALEAARNDPDPEVRQMALTWLIEKDNEQALDVAQSMLASTEDAHVRQAAVMALARSRNDRARTILRDFVRSDAPVELRGEALMALPLNRNADDATFLRSLYGETSDKQLKEYALMALGRRSLEGDTDWLLSIAQDESEDIDLRTQAVWMLRSDSSVPVTQIATLYDRSDNRKIREAALMIIAERSRNDSAALDKLIGIARDEKDVDLRRQAVSTLSRSRDPRAQAVLLEIIRKK